MAKIKHWNLGEVAEITDYLENIGGRAVESLLRIYDEDGRLINTVSDQAARASGALIEIADRFTADEPALFDQRTFDDAVDQWCEEYLVEGGREKLLSALRTRRWRAAKEKAKQERPPRNAASILSWLYSQDPEAAAEACAVFLEGWQRTEKPRGKRRGRSDAGTKASEPTLDELKASLVDAEDAVKTARSQMQKTHPDKGGKVEEFHKARAEFEIAKHLVTEIMARIDAFKQAA